MGHSANGARNSSNDLAPGVCMNPCKGSGSSQTARIEMAPSSPYRAGLITGPRGVTRTSSSTSLPPRTRNASRRVSAGYILAVFEDRTAVGPDALEEEVGVVGEAGGDAPGAVPVVADGYCRRAGKGGAGDGPAGRLDARQVPVRRRDGREMGVVGQDGSSGPRLFS